LKTKKSHQMENIETSKGRNPNWGGSRKNAGRKKKYGEQTRAVTVRVPVSKIELVKSAVREILSNAAALVENS